MNATEELRRLLTEAGVEWKAPESYDGSFEHDTIVGDYWFHEYDGKITVHGLTPAQAIDATLGPQITEDTSDGWHSFKDLYHHRALLFSVIVHNYKDMCWKSKRHHDGKELDWNFIVGIDTPWGQASYHYGMDYWDMFDCKVLERAPYYDGYTADESVARIARLVELEPSTLGAGTCYDEGDPSDFCCSECGVRMFTDTSDTYTMIASDGRTIIKRPNYCPNCGKRVTP